MKKKVLLLAVSCKLGGLCPGGLDLDNPKEWIRIVKDDGNSGAVQGHEIDFAEPLDVIEFDGRPMPQGKQVENWVIDNNSCKNLGRDTLFSGNRNQILKFARESYGYHLFWNNFKAYLDETEFNNVTAPSESIMRVTDVHLYKDEKRKAKIDFNWDGARYPLKWISLTDQNFYDILDEKDVEMKEALIVVSIPKACDEWHNPSTGETRSPRAYKFVSKVFDLTKLQE